MSHTDPVPQTTKREGECVACAGRSEHVQLLHGSTVTSCSTAVLEAGSASLTAIVEELPWPPLHYTPLNLSSILLCYRTSLQASTFQFMIGNRV